jgi:hypothetical protein
MEFNEASVSKQNLLTEELSDPSESSDVKTLKSTQNNKITASSPIEAEGCWTIRLSCPISLLECD